MAIEYSGLGIRVETCPIVKYTRCQQPKNSIEFSEWVISVPLPWRRLQNKEYTIHVSANSLRNAGAFGVCPHGHGKYLVF